MLELNGQFFSPLEKMSTLVVMPGAKAPGS